MASASNIRHIVDSEVELTVISTECPLGTVSRMPLYRLNLYYDFHDVYDSFHPNDRLHMLLSDPRVLVLDMQLQELLTSFQFFSLKDLRRLATVHQVYFWMHTKAQLHHELLHHICSASCRSHSFIVFRELQSPRTTIISAVRSTGVPFGSDPVAGTVPTFLRHNYNTTPVAPSSHLSDIVPMSGSATESFARMPSASSPARVSSAAVSARVPVDAGSDAATSPAAASSSSITVNSTSTRATRRATLFDSSSHDTGDLTHLDILSAEDKFSILSTFEKETSTEALRMGVCAACGVRIYQSDLEWTPTSQIDLSLLSNPNLPEHLRPREYNASMYQHAVLHYKGLQYLDALGSIRLCTNNCLPSLQRGRMPRLALANDLYTAHAALPAEVRQAMDDSTILDRKLACRARCNNICCKFVKEDTTNPRHSSNSTLSEARRGIKGNVMVVPLDAIRMNSVLPPRVSDIKDTMCAVFVGSFRPSANDILTSKYSPILVRRSRVKTMIQFLLNCNPYYHPDVGDVSYSEANLNTILPPGTEEDVPSFVEIGHINSNDNVEAASAEYAPRGNPMEITEQDQEFLFENVGFTDSASAPSNYESMKAFALERCRRGKPFLLAGTREGLVSDFHNPCILTWLFPHLDPWGIIGFSHPGRRIRLSMQEQLSHLLRLDDTRFQRDREFAFVFYNVLRKMQVSQSIRFTVSPRVHQRLATDLMAIEPDVLLSLGQKIGNDPMYHPQSDEERTVLNTISSISMAARHIPGSNGYKVLLRNQIRALINYRGTPTLFITLNPSDVDNPIVRLLTGEDIQLEDILRGEDMRSWQRRLLAAYHPAECALFFDLLITKFIRIALGYREGASQRGLFGMCDAYYGTVEAQGKGTLHCHMLVWLRGHLSPGRLREQMMSSEDYRERTFRWVESIVKCEFPTPGASNAESMRSQPRILRTNVELGNPNPGVIPAPTTTAHLPHGDNIFWENYNAYLHQLLHNYNWHIHGSTCWKYLRLGEARNDQSCRLRMNGTVRQDTCLDSESGALLLRRHHPKIAAYNDAVTFMLKCNTELKFIGSGKAARDLVFYATDYITKPSLPLQAGIAAMQYAIQKIDSRIGSSTTNLTAGTNAGVVITAVNSLMGRQEISHPQVMSYLIGGGDHYTSHKFTVVNWRIISAYISAEIARNSAHPVTGDAEDLVHDAQLDLNIGRDSVTVSSQEMDYMYRNDHSDYASLCLYDFFALLTKSRVPSHFRARNTPIEQVPGSFSDWRHPQRASHRMHFRTECYVPVLLGPSIPNPLRSPAVREKWARDVLILFKPWRQVSDLLGNHDSWISAYEEYATHISIAHQRIIENMNAFSESLDARVDAPLRSRHHLTDDNFPTHLSGDDVDMSLPELDASAFQEVNLDDAEEYDVQDVFLCTTDNSADGDILDNIVSQTVGSEIVSALDICQGGPWHPPAYNAQDDINMKEATVDDLPTIVEHQTVMAAKRKAGRTPMEDLDNDNDSGGPLNLQRRIRRHVTRPTVDIIAIPPGNNERTGLTREEENAALQDIVQEVIDEMNLASNAEQLRAFNTVANHVIRGDTQQLLMYVSGVGGTGKSHVIRSIVMLFDKLGIRDTLLLGAPTGIAAVLIGGHTMHSLVQLNPNGKSRNIERLAKAWKGVMYLIVDEISMVGAKFLSEFSNRIRDAKSSCGQPSSLPFAGVNVIFMGDFGQLKPPKQKSLYSHTITKSQSFLTASSIDGIDATNGILLWRQVTTVVELKKNQRQASDPLFADFLLRLRSGTCTPPRSPASTNYWEYLKNRLLNKLQPDALRTFRDAPIVVGSKLVRDVLNAKLINYKSMSLQRKVHIYHSTDSVSRAQVPIGLRRKLWSVSSSNNQEAFGRLPLFEGMKVMITENIAFGDNIVNGTEGIIVSVYHNEDNNGIKTAIMAYVHVPGCGLRLPGLADDIVPIYPVATSIQYSFFMHSGQECKSFTRKQLPLVPGYAYTDYKSQGRTLTRVILDIATARGQGVYVMLSRVKDLAGLAILRWFPATKVYARLPAELREELERLERLAA